VAKGIRRILAVTKDTAAECSASGSRILASLERCEALPSSLVGPDAAALRKELDQSFISAPLKTSMRLRLETIQKRAQEAAKAEAGRKLNAVLGEVTEAVEKKQVCVIKFTGIEGKGAQKIAEKVKKANPDCSFFGVIEGEDGKVSCFASVPDGREVNAGAWIKEVTGKFGGRGGGKPAFAQGQVPEGTQAQEVVAAAAAANNIGLE
jgi:alanyl-tRNA synthetase